MTEQPEKPQDDDRLSLAPLDPETALRALLAVDPNDDHPADDDEPPAQEARKDA